MERGWEDATRPGGSAGRPGGTLGVEITDEGTDSTEEGRGAGEEVVVSGAHDPGSDAAAPESVGELGWGGVMSVR